MKCLLLSFILLLLSPLLAHAENAVSIDQIAYDFGLRTTSHGKPWTFTGVNHLYMSGSMDQAIMVIDQVPGKLKEARIIHDKANLIYEFPVSSEFYTSVLFYNLDQDRLLPYLEKEKKVVKFLKGLKNVFMSSAHAAVDNCGAASAEGAIDGNFTKLAGQYAADYFELGLSCFLGAQEGAYDATVGMVVDAGKGLWNLAKDPKAFWNKKVQEFKQIKAFFQNFEASVQSMVSGFKSLPAVTKAQILCSFIGSIGTDVLIGILTAGASSPKLALSIKNFLGKFVQIESLLAKLNKIGKLAELPKEFYNKLAKGKILDKSLNSIKSLTSHGFDDYALQLAKCSL